MASTAEEQKTASALTNGDNKNVAPLPTSNTAAASNEAKRTVENKKRKRPKKKQKPATAVDTSNGIFAMMQRDVTVGLTHCEPFQIMEVINAAIKPNPGILYHTCMEVKHDLTNIFSRSFQNVRVEVFGSSIMGTAFKDSDFDFYVQLPHIDEFPPSLAVRDAIKLLAPSRKFTKFVPIPSARIPILKCLHVRSGYSCDLNFSDSLGLFNSPILGSLLTFDERISDLATILKYWMKIHDLSGSSKISNYSLMWLLIFYLQTMKVPIIPPIKTFQKNMTPYYVNDMNLAFNQYWPNKTKNRQRQSDLLLGFFEFFKDFDFESNIICPLHAKAFPKKDLLETHPNEFSRYIEVMRLRPNSPGLRLNKCICIQDPFDICQTIPGNISKQSYKDFRTKLGIAANLYKKAIADKGESGSLLLALFDTKAFNEIIPAPDKIRSTASKSTSLVKIMPIESEVALARKFLLRERGPESVIKSDDIKAFWAKKVIEFSLNMFKDIFCLQITLENVNKTEKDEETSETSSKSPKVDGQSDVHTNDLLKVIRLCGTRDVFYGRKQQKSLTPRFIQDEIAASKQRLENNKLEINFKALVKLEASPLNSDFVSIEFSDLVATKKNNFFKGFQSLFTAIVRHYLKGYFLDFQTVNDLGPNVDAIPIRQGKKKIRGQNKNLCNEQKVGGEKDTDAKPEADPEAPTDVPPKVNADRRVVNLEVLPEVLPEINPETKP